MAIKLDSYEHSDDNVHFSRCADDDQTKCTIAKCSVFGHKYNHLHDRRKAVDQHFELAQAAVEADLSGCAILDSGASIGMTSDNVLQSMHETYRVEGEGLYPNEAPKQSNLTVTVADGTKLKIGYETPIKPITESPFAGRSYMVHVQADRPQNNSPMLVGSDYLKSNKCIVGFDQGIMIYKDQPNVVHHLPTSKNGHTLLMPISREACEKLLYNRSP